MPRLKPQYTSDVTPQYKQATAKKRIRYTIAQNVADYPDILTEFNEWKAKKGPAVVPSFAGIFHTSYSPTLFDIRKAEIREDWGQRNALADRTRKRKILGIAKKFDPMQFQPIDVDYIVDEDLFIIRDGGGRGTSAFLNDVFMVPASIRIVKDVDESRRLFNAQDKFNAAISSYDKFLQQLLDNTHSRHKMACDTWSIANSSKFCLDYLNKSQDTPLVEGISTLQRVIRTVGGDHAKVEWGKKSAPNISTAIDLIKATFVGIDEIPVSALEAITAFIHISKNRIPNGEEGFGRLKEFMALVRDSSEQLNKLTNWSTELFFDSSNNYATYGAAALMTQWNIAFKNKNKGRTNSYRYVKWEREEIEIIKSHIMQFSRDDSLYPDA
jgi:hypothetical protein|tara:strand:+ start:382 stop:1530 length:1149 start_codon:yes stop_codon:yes gene_type:complete